MVGIRDAKLSEKLQLDAELTLSKAVSQVCQAEAVKLQQPLVRGGTHEAVSVGGVSYKGKDNSRVVPGDSSRSTRRKQTSNSTDRKPCSRCGKSSSHEYNNCSARNAVCCQCHKRGHYQVVCRTDKSGKVQQVVEEENSDDYFLGAVGDKEPGEQSITSQWISLLTLVQK